MLRIWVRTSRAVAVTPATQLAPPIDRTTVDGDDRLITCWRQTRFDRIIIFATSDRCRNVIHAAVSAAAITSPPSSSPDARYINRRPVFPAGPLTVSAQLINSPTAPKDIVTSRRARKTRLSWLSSLTPERCVR